MVKLSPSASLKAQEPRLPVSSESNRRWMSQLNKKEQIHPSAIFKIQVLNALHIAHLH